MSRTFSTVVRSHSADSVGREIILADPPRVELGLEDSKSPVLPLHHGPIGWRR